MATQLALRFEDVPLTCDVQARYHALAPALAGQKTPQQLAQELNVSYATVTRWLRQFREQGLPGLFPTTDTGRAPYTPERVIVQVIFYKCCVPQVGERELARVVAATTGHVLHHQTVKQLTERFFFWRYPEFQQRIRYPVPTAPLALRQEIVRLSKQGWTEVRLAQLLHLNRKTIRKWLRRAHPTAPTGADATTPTQLSLLDLSRAPHQPQRKVYFGTIYAILQLQKKYGYAGWFRIQGYLEMDYGIVLGASTIKKIMALNRRLHLAPQRPAQEPALRDPREGPPKSERAFQHTFIDLRYLDAKPEGVQLYSCLLLEGLSRTILAGSLTTGQDVGVILHLYFQALVRWGRWEEVISDHGGQFQSHAFARVHRKLPIQHTMYEKGHPWQNLIESQFGIQARVGEYHWERCGSIAAAQEFHRELIRDHNRLPHFAHRKRQDQKRTPLAVLGDAQGKTVEPAALHQAFSRKFWQRKTDARGFVRLGRWKLYIEEGLPRTPVEIHYWDGKLRAEYDTQLLTEYDCTWDQQQQVPQQLRNWSLQPHPYQSKQILLFDPLWRREPVEQESNRARPSPKSQPTAQQQRFYFGPELVKSA